MSAEASKKPDNPSTYEIVVNGQLKEVPAATVTYASVGAIAFPEHAGNGDITFVITYRKAHEPKEGSLTEGGTVEVKHRGTVFNVTFTRRS
ncbi:hypothetical protein NS220_04545 [Microbacterium testaceum]|uniref:Multi-ubiquitin domain-containing protein n=1 Tax=Microbacterium testaceum TaxID=2033 RepID=A0A147EZI2_MICTE|nr:multiubiquitin domain-containing protein [Microbacterium testaceum]KTR95830.1 hypothetical protein NS220_04545 [Microbacterium testaceum]